MTRFIPFLLVAVSIQATSPAAAQAPPPARDYTAADVRFMSGMIYHHAQAVMIAAWAPTHGASPAVRTLCERIAAGQTDEIALLSRWLADRHEVVPHPEPEHMMMAGMDSTNLMPGMLTGGQPGQPAPPPGPTSDHFFLRLMIHHTQGPTPMGNNRFPATGAEKG